MISHQLYVFYRSCGNLLNSLHNLPLLPTSKRGILSLGRVNLVQPWRRTLKMVVGGVGYPLEHLAKYVWLSNMVSHQLHVFYRSCGNLLNSLHNLPLLPTSKRGILSLGRVNLVQPWRRTLKMVVGGVGYPLEHLAKYVWLSNMVSHQLHVFYRSCSNLLNSLHNLPLLPTSKRGILSLGRVNLVQPWRRTLKVVVGGLGYPLEHLAKYVWLSNMVSHQLHVFYRSCGNLLNSLHNLPLLPTSKCGILSLGRVNLVQPWRRTLKVVVGGVGYPLEHSAKYVWLSNMVSRQLHVFYRSCGNLLNSLHNLPLLPTSKCGILSLGRVNLVQPWRRTLKVGIEVVS